MCWSVLTVYGSVLTMCGSVLTVCGSVLTACGSVLTELLEPLELLTQLAFLRLLRPGEPRCEWLLSCLWRELSTEL